MPKIRFPLVGSLMTRTAVNSTPVGTKDQQFKNCFPVVYRNPVTGKATVQLAKREGSILRQTLGSGAAFSGANAYGTVVWTGYDNKAHFSLSDGVLATKKVEVYNHSGTRVGGAGFDGTGCNSLTETLLSGTATLVALVINGTVSTTIDAFYYQPAGAWTKITDTDYPGNQTPVRTVVGEAVHKDGYMFVMDSTGRIWNSDLNSVTSWTSTSFIDAQDSPDLGVGLALVGDHVVALGAKSIQFFKHGGNATGSPLTKTPNTINIGVELYNSNSARPYITSGDELYIVGVNQKDIARGIYVLSSGSLKKISNAAIDQYLNSAGFSFANFIGSWVNRGQTHVVMAIYTTGMNEVPEIWCYAKDTRFWWRFNFAGTETTMTQVSGKYFLDTRSMYEFGNAEGQDNSSTFEMQARTQPLDMNRGQLKEFTSFRVIGDTPTVAGNLSVQWSDDDYQNFSTAKLIAMANDNKVIQAGLGWGRRRAWQLSESIARPLQIEAVEIEYEVAES